MGNYNWNYPTTMWVGENRINDIAEACKNLRITKPLSVTSKGLTIPKLLQAAAISLILFSPTHIVVG